MNTLAVVGSKASELHPQLQLQPISLKGKAMACGLIPTPGSMPVDSAPLADASVLLRILAFSCNYRDQPLLLASYQENPEKCLWPVGSEFVAEVVRCGARVEGFKPGDRVMPDHAFFGARFGDKPNNGVITNNASVEYQIHPARKLIKVPEGMDDVTAAAFSLGSQTVYSMVRKIRVGPGDRVLVMSASSNTSLFALAALKARGVNLVIHTGSPHGEALRDRFGALALVRGGSGWQERLPRLADELGGFDAVVDPFFDVNAGTAIHTLRPGGRYVSCGTLKQFGPEVDYGPNIQPTEIRNLVMVGILNNLEIHFNCLGLRQDLEAALDDYLAGRYAIQIDSVFGPGEEAAFLQRTFAVRDRLGKVVFRYGERE